MIFAPNTSTMGFYWFARELDKRELTKGLAAIDAHLKSLVPMIEEVGFIPTVDHTVPPDVIWEHFQYYMERKQELLRGRL